jgi:ribosome-binding factor A
VKIQRVRKLESLLLSEISQRIRREVKDPRVSAITVTRVEVTPDARQAKVFVVSFAGRADSQEMDSIIEGLQSASGFLRHGLVRDLELRVAPELLFIFDKGLENSFRVQELLKKI